MIVISSKELSSNPAKYLNLAKTEQVLIKHGENDRFLLSQDNRLQPDEELARAITAEELLVGIEEDIRDMFRRRNKK